MSHSWTTCKKCGEITYSETEILCDNCKGNGFRKEMEEKLYFPALPNEIKDKVTLMDDTTQLIKNINEEAEKRLVETKQLAFEEQQRVYSKKSKQSNKKYHKRKKAKNGKTKKRKK